MTHNLKYVFCAIVLAGIMLLGPVPVAADEIVLQNGDRLTGTVQKMEKGVLILETKYSPPIEITISVIRQIQTENPVEIHLSDGKILKGKIRSEKESLITITPTDHREETTITMEKIIAINPPPVKWEGEITFGANMQKGNTERTGLSAEVEGEKRSEKDRINLHYIFNYSEEKTEVTTRNHFGALKYDYFFLEKMYGYLGTEAFSDTFRDIKLRITIGPGIGYQVWEDQRKKLGVEAGLSYLFENHENTENRDFWEARLAANFRYNFNKYLVFSEQVEIYPNLESGGQYRLRNEAVIKAPLGAGWAMRLSHILDYVSDPADEKKKTDTNAIFGLEYTF